MVVSMNEYRYSDIEVGEKETFSAIITEKMMQQFLEITGDVNPLHNDREFAKSHNYPDKVAYGMLTASFLSTMAGVYLPGKNSLIMETQTKFVKPVFCGDTLTIEGKVAEKDDRFQIIILKVTIQNQNHEKVCKAEMKVRVLDE